MMHKFRKETKLVNLQYKSLNSEQTDYKDGDMNTKIATSKEIQLQK